MGEYWHPDVDDVVTAHEYAGFVSRIRTTGFLKSSEHGIERIQEVIDEAEEQEDLYPAAAVYLKQIIKKHPFSDGNHRTAYIVALQFIRENDGTFVPEQTLSDQEIADVLKDEIKFKEVGDIAEWIETGEFP
ncbi:MAG: type II toxin-antitoxin system death-on-curing family toxin [Candidatus Nanohaloarchaea archaeon]|nr:type II toxin-antitoxin system death-on-curing family toxin [Candidatus Nanohaloarchaea archaeon]